MRGQQVEECLVVGLGAERRPITARQLAGHMREVLLGPVGSSDTTTARPLNISQNRSLLTAVSMLPPCLRLPRPRSADGTPIPLYLTEQAARPLIHRRHAPPSYRDSGR